jgi:hypothetical protein
MNRIERILAGKAVIEAGMLERVAVSHYSFSNRYHSLGAESRRIQAAE